MKKQKEIHFRRHGDINLYPITKTEYDAIQGEKIKHNGNFVIQEGETTGHKHVLTVDKVDFMEIKKMPNGLYAFISKGGVLKHEDHKILEVAPTYYKEVREREIDWFAEGVVRRVVD